MKKILILLVSIFVFCGCSSSKKEISCNNYQREVKAGAVLIDVRTKQEYDTGHLNNAISLPLDQIDNITSIIEDKDTYIIVYCQSGNRSKQALNKLKTMGYKNIYDMGGINNCKTSV